MTQSTPLLARSNAVRWLFAAGLVFIPFDAIRGVGALGELGNELSFPFFAAAIALAMVSAVRSGENRLSASLALRVGVAILALTIVSFVVNFGEIQSIVFRERTGTNKFVTSLLVVLYGIALAWLAEQVEPEEYTHRVARFICWSVAICIFYIIVELAGRNGLMGGLFRTIDDLVHTRQADVVNAWNGQVNEKVLYGWDERYRSVSFEPPAFGNFTGFAWPWVWYAAVKAKSRRTLRSWTLLIAFTLVIIVTASRTGLLMLMVNCGLLALIAGLYARRGGHTEAAAAARLLVPVGLIGVGLIAALYIATNFQNIVVGVVAGESVSNLSRLAMQTAAFKMFMAHPLFGVGLGQFGFHVTEFLPSWAFRSPEVGPMITYPLAPWPNVYSVYARIGAELGMAGLIGWCVLWLGLAWKLAIRARHDRRDGDSVVTWHFPVVLNCIGVLVSGFTTDTFRTPMIWIALGLGCGLLLRSRVAAEGRISAAAVPAE
ncbi:O-antigen ligase family protein [Sphingomonas piscis]|uniref:O-antigen ligase family protein n=1 Tax=Sphingomonas piscis TaxID=2714943 RepID=A0A6G7YRT8_9SPHN|nr:O-antigen ligase family protein [Sphingomonas piscis]QIK79453.1 O-antigen ligase family protein [Sphingomonas piscis]